MKYLRREGNPNRLFVWDPVLAMKPGMVEVEVPDTQPLQEMDRNSLVKLASEKGIRYPNRIKSDKLVELLSKQEEETPDGINNVL